VVFMHSTVMEFFAAVGVGELLERVSTHSTGLGACRSNRGWLAIARSRWVLDVLWVDVVAQGLVGTTAI